MAEEMEEMVPLAGTQKEEIPDPPERRKALVSEVQARVRGAKAFHEKSFLKMKRDMESAYKGFSDKDWDETKYVANILQRHIAQRTAALYAKNPKPMATRRHRLDYSIWDGDEKTLSNAMAVIEEASSVGAMPPMEALQLVQDVEVVKQQRKMIDRVGKTMEFLFDYFMDEQQPSFKASMKALVRRVITTGCGYVKVGFQREMERSPEVAARIADVQAQMDHIHRLMDDAAQGEISPDDAQMEELRLSMQSLMEEPMVLIREGLLFDFPEADSVIVDPKCRQLRGFVGANWIAHEMYLTPDEVEEIFGVDIKQDFLSYDLDGRRSDRKDLFRQGYQYDGQTPTDMQNGMACVWEVYDRKAGLMYCVADGHKDFLYEPKAPPCKVEGFWPIFALVFNEMEHKDQLYPPSDTQLLLPMQHEYNRARQGLREHRRANRPKYGVPAGMLEQEDKIKLQNHPAHAVIELQALAAGQKINDVVQPMQQIGIDQNLYEVGSLFDDVQLVVGAQEANFGQISKGTATETSIAESSRMSALGAQVDELDSFMSDICRAAGQVLLDKMSLEQVQRLAGPGSAWPESLRRREEIFAEVYLQIEAGSTGKPNRAQELQNIERIIPFLIQIPGIDPKFLAKELLSRLDDKMDLAEAMVESLPSIIAMNQLQGASPVSQGGGANNPQLQGPRGGNNAALPSPAGGSLPPMGANRPVN
tara:strand:- start:791 stop:2899 length:2109 start_codon:yes stop_codon:yes gene_type:complete